LVALLLPIARAAFSAGFLLVPTIFIFGLATGRHPARGTDDAGLSRTQAELKESGVAKTRSLFFADQIKPRSHNAVGFAVGHWEEP
jgi:hypothetical protein